MFSEFHEIALIVIGLKHVLLAVEESPRPHVGRTVRVERLVAHRRDAALLEEVLEGVKAPARTVRDAVGVDVLKVQHEAREHQRACRTASRT